MRMPHGAHSPRLSTGLLGSKSFHESRTWPVCEPLPPGPSSADLSELIGGGQSVREGGQVGREKRRETRLAGRPWQKVPERLRQNADVSLTPGCTTVQSPKPGTHLATFGPQNKMVHTVEIM